MHSRRTKRDGEATTSEMLETRSMRRVILKAQDPVHYVVMGHWATGKGVC